MYVAFIFVNITTLLDRTYELKMNKAACKRVCKLFLARCDGDV